MTSFSQFSDRKTREAESAVLRRLETVDDRSAAFNTIQIGNDWSFQHYDGLFHLPEPLPSGLPALSLVFVQSREGNTAAANPEDLGGGPVDKHLIYEGLSRVAADAVLAGAKTAEGENTFFSVWHPEIVAMRAALGLARHPAQIVVSGTGVVDLARTRIFNAPDVPVYVISTARGCDALARTIRAHQSIEVLPMSGGGLREPLEYLRAKCGIRRISAVGGRTTASALIDEGLIQDLCLTTTDRLAGEPDTPLYAGKKRPPEFRLLVRKRGTDPDYPIVFEHLAVSSGR